MVKKTKKMDKFKIIITFWVLIFIVAISFLFSLILLKKQIDEYENDSSIKIELVQLTNQFLNASDYLTNQIKAFTVTAYPKHLDNYWREVDISKNREKIIDRIRQFKNLVEEINLISESKKTPMH